MSYFKDDTTPISYIIKDWKLFGNKASVFWK